MVLYLDSALLCSFFMNCVCLFISKSALRIFIKKRRIFLASFAYSVLSVISVIFPFFRYICILLYVPSIRLIFGKSSIFELIRRSGIHLGCTYIASSILFGIIPQTKTCELWVNARRYFVAEDIYFYVSLIFVFLACSTVVFFMSKTKIIYHVKITVDGQEIETPAMIDTGNSLRHKKNGAPVIIGERRLFENLSVDPEIIPYKNIGKSAAYTEIYPVEKLYFTEQHKEYKDLYITFVDRPLSSTGKYALLLNNFFLT